MEKNITSGPGKPLIYQVTIDLKLLEELCTQGAGYLFTYIVITPKMI